MMISSLKEKLWIGGFVLAVLVIGFFVVTLILRVFPIEGITYPESTSNLSIIETWSEKEVYSFSDALGCFDLPYNEEFGSKFPEAIEFCEKVRRIWVEKYNQGKAAKMNWDLYHSLDKGNE